MKIIKRYIIFIILIIINIIMLFIFPDTGRKSFSITGKNFLEMLEVIPPIFILLGLLDVWVKRETMIKYLGENSGIVGILISFFLGAVAAGPLYAAFPVAGILLKKGSKITNVLIFIGAWSTMKIPLLLFESTSLGLKFTVIRLTLSIVGILVMTFITGKILNSKDKQSIYDIHKETSTS
jgi:uncharacterized membrane protein YraQ (UPF0718 family)